MSCSYGITLSLLEGPTKAAVGTLIAAAVPSSAYCFVYREKYDDDIFSVSNSSFLNCICCISLHSTLLYSTGSVP
jgi:hypothetical protein